MYLPCLHYAYTKRIRATQLVALIRYVSTIKRTNAQGTDHLPVLLILISEQ